MKRAIVIVIDSMGIGALDDAEEFGDDLSCNTIVNLAEKSGGLKVKNFLFCGIGEPLTNKLLPDMVKYCKDHNICDRIELTTNASLLTHKLSDSLIDAGLTRLLISIQGVTKEKYKKICGYNINFEKFIDEIRYFYENRKNCKVYIKTVDLALDNELEREKFFDIFSPICDTINVEKVFPNCDDGIHWDEFIPKSNGFTRYGYNYKKKKCCDSLFRLMYIFPNGDINACACQNPPLIIGNVYKNSLTEIWNKGLHKKYMIMHLTGSRNEISRWASNG